MSYFNIDFNQFKPSTKTPVATPSATKVTPTIPATNSASINKVVTPSPTPTPVTTQLQTQVQETPKKEGFLSKALNFLATPLYAYGGFLQGTRKQSEKRVAELRSTNSKPQLSDYLGSFKAGIQNIPSGIKNRYTPGQYLVNDWAKLTPEKVNEISGGDENLKTGLNIARGGAMLTTDLVADPSNLIPFEKIGGLLSKGASKIDEVVGLSNQVKKVTDWARKTPIIYKTVEKVDPFFRNPEFKEMLNVTKEVTNTKLNKLYRQVSDAVIGLTPEEQRIVGDALEGIKVAPKYEKIAAPFRQLAEEVGQQAVDLGIFSKKAFEANRGTYMKHLFEDYVLNKNTGDKFLRNVSNLTPKFSGQFSQRRWGKAGYIKEFSAPTFAGIGSGIKDVELGKFYKTVADKFGVPTEIVKEGKKIVSRVAPDGYKVAKESIENAKVARLFKNLSLPNEIVDYINKTFRYTPQTFADKAMNAWKAGKTIYNPAYHARNLMSNQILSDMSTGRGLFGTVSDYIKAVKEYQGKGFQGFVDAAKETGLIGRKQLGAGVQEFLDVSGLTEKNLARKIFESPQVFQQASEETAKLNVFKTWVTKYADEAGVTIQKALKDPDIIKKAASKAEEAIFSPYRISQTERGLVKNVIPFYSFTRQALPFTVKTAVQNPTRLTKYIKLKNDVEQMSTPENGQMPDYAKNMIRTPFKNKQGKNVYFDPSYIYPFGNFGDMGSQGRLPFGLSINPFLSEVGQQIANQDWYFGQPISTSMIPSRSFGQRVAHAARAASPTFLVNAVSKVAPAIIGKTDYAGRQRDWIQALMDSIFGLKSSTVNTQSAQLRSAKNKNTFLKNKAYEMQDIITDQSISPEKKQKLIQQLRSVQAPE